MNRQVPTWAIVLVVVVVSLVLIVAGSVWMQTTSAAGQAHDAYTEYLENTGQR
jgi:hypothetical protein